MRKQVIKAFTSTANTFKAETLAKLKEYFVHGINTETDSDLQFDMQRLLNLLLGIDRL